MDATFHYPPEVLNLLVDTIPLLCKSKRDVFLFFQGAGVSESIVGDLRLRLSADSDGIGKYEIARTVLVRLNELGDAGLRQRREVVKRVVEFEEFAVSCWPDDQLKAKGLVAEVARVVNVKDSFTRMREEQERERTLRMQEQRAKLDALAQRRRALAGIKDEFYGLFKELDAQRRGKALEGVLNRIFETSGILIREAFTLQSIEDAGVVEQVDGVVGNVPTNGVIHRP